MGAGRCSGRTAPRLESLQHDLAARLSGFDESMGPPEIGGVDRPEILGKGRAYGAFIDEARHFAKQTTLFGDVGGVKQRAREHQFPVRGHALALQGNDVEGSRIVNERKAALRRNKLDDLGEMAVRIVRRENERRCADLERGDFAGQRALVIYNVVCTEIGCPGYCFRP